VKNTAARPQNQLPESTFGPRHLLSASKRFGIAFRRIKMGWASVHWAAASDVYVVEKGGRL
jgi:hypothetical protein